MSKNVAVVGSDDDKYFKSNTLWLLDFDPGNDKCRNCVIAERKFPGMGYRCCKFPECGYPHHPGGCQCGCNTP